jgi:hypothetical protein
MFKVNLPELTQALFDVDGNKIGYGLFFAEVKEHANHKLQILALNQKAIQKLYETYQKYLPDPKHVHHECCGCELTEQGKIEKKLLESILTALFD